MRLLSMFAALGVLACQTEETKQLAALYSEMKQSLAERESCTLPTGRCTKPLATLREEAARLEKLLPRATQTDEQVRKRIHDAVARTGVMPTYKVAEEKPAGTLSRRIVTATFQGVEQEAAGFVVALCAQPRLVAAVRAVRKPTFPTSWEVDAELYRYLIPPAQVAPPPDAARADRISGSRLSGGQAVDLRKAIRYYGDKLAPLRDTPDSASFRALREDIDAWREASTVLAVQKNAACDTFRDLLRNPQVRLESINALDRPPHKYQIVGRGALPSNPRLIFGEGYEATLDAAPAQGLFRLVLTRK